MKSFLITMQTVILFIFISVELSAQWTQVLPSQNGSIFALKLKGTLNFFAGSDESGVFRTTDNGENWTTVNSGLTDLRVHSLVVNGTSLFAGTLGGVFLSTDNATSWTAVNSGLTNLNIYPLAVSGMNLFAGTSSSGVFLSTDNGTSWTAVNSGLSNLNLLSLFAVDGTNILAGTDGDGVFLSTDNGSSWTAINSGLTDLSVLSFAVVGTDLFAGTSGGSSNGAWRRPLSEIIASVKETTLNHIPDKYLLGQNYPNPFNPSTKIKYSIPQSSNVKIEVYDIIGNSIETLINKEQPAGTYELTWYAGGLPSGIYFYQLSAGDFISTKKMILMK